MARPFDAIGYELVRKHYYSPIPDLRALNRDVFTRKSALAGVSIDPADGLAFLQRELAPFLNEYRPPVVASSDPRRYYLDNGFYGTVDAEVLYAMVRRFRPNRVLELGSGLSTLVIADARARNHQEETAGHVVCDPYPRAELVSALAQVAELRATSAVDLPETEFAQLRSGDLLFVDTTHTVKIGGDVNRILLDIVPTLAPGVLIHIHDIYLPWEYPREFLVERRFFWAEQYLLQAFLAFNDQFETLIGTHALARRYPTEISSLVPSFEPVNRSTTPPSAFWMRRTVG